MTQPAAEPAPTRRAAWLCLAFPAAYFAFAAGFAVQHYAQYGAATPQFLRYIAAPALLAAFLIGCGWLAPTRTGARVGVFAIAILMGLFGFETLMSVRLYSMLLGQVGQSGPGYAAAVATANGLPSAYTVNEVNRAIGTVRLADAVLGGIPNRRVLLCANNGVPMLYQADRFGFNNPDSVYSAPVDTMVVGDSFVEGVCLPGGDDMISQLRAARPRTVGIGIRGSGPLTGLANLGRYGPVLRPRTVVIAFFEGNDWKNLGVELQMPWMNQPLRPGTDFGPVTPPPAVLARIDNVVDRWKMPDPGLREVLARTHFARNFVALQQSGSQIGISYPKVTPHRPEYVGILRSARQVAATWGGEVVLLYIPRTDRYLGLMEQDFVYDDLRRQVLAAAATNRIDVIDLAKAFRAHAAPHTLFAPDGHFSAAGASLAAGLTAKNLRNRSRTAERED